MILSAHSHILTVQNIKYEFLKYCYFISSASKTMSSRVPKKLQYIQQVFVFLFGQAFRDRPATKPQIQQINMATKSTVIDNQFFNKKKTFWVFKKLFLFFLSFEAISCKNSDTYTPFPLIQYWLQVCLVVLAHRCLAQVFKIWHNIEPGRRGHYGYL